MAAAQDGTARGRCGAIIAVMRYCRPNLRRTLRRKGAGAAAETGCGTSSPLSFTAGCGPGAPEMHSHDEMAAGGTPLNTGSLVRNEFR